MEKKLLRAVFPYVINWDTAGAVLVMGLMHNMGVTNEMGTLKREQWQK